MEIARRQHSIDLESDARRAHSRGPHSQLGQAMVELALLMPIFLLLILGSAEFARLAYAAIEVSNAARAGVAYGAQTHITASDVPGITTAALNEATNVSAMNAAGVSVSNFCTCTTGGSVVCTNALASCASPARVIEYVQVNTTANVNPLIHLPGLPTTFTLHGQAIMRVLQ